MTLFSFELYENLPLPYTVLFVFLGAALGSFFNVLSIRWPPSIIRKNDDEAIFWLGLRGVKAKAPSVSHFDIPSLLGGRSHCPSCHKAIPMYLNIPILSWLMLRGRAQCCKTPISVRYLAFELMGAGLFLSIAITIGPSMYGLMLGLLFMLMTLMAVLDFNEGFVPDALLFSSMMVCALLGTGPHMHSLDHMLIMYLCGFLGTLIPFYILSTLAGKDMVGMADFHLLGLSAALLGTMVFTALIPIVALLLINWWALKRFNLKRGIFIKLISSDAVPAAPAIMAGTILTFLAYHSNSMLKLF